MFWKHVLVVVLALFFGFPALAYADTHYWVGGSGNWSDASHWSLASGGAGGSAPATNDNIVFDANSCTGGCSSAISTVDSSIIIGTLNTTGSSIDIVINDVTFQVSTVTIGTGRTVTNNSVTNGASVIGGLTGAGTWVQGVNAILKYNGFTTQASVAQLDFTASGNIVKYNRNSTSSTTMNVYSTTYANLTVGDTVAAQRQYNLRGDITVNEVLSLGNPTYYIGLADGGYTITLAGSGTPLVITGSATIFSTGTVIYTGTEATNVAATDYPNLQINQAGTTFSHIGDRYIGVDGNLTVTAGTLDVNANSIYVSGNTSVEGGTLDLTDGIFDAGSGLVFGNISVTSGTLIAPTGSDLILTGNWEVSGTGVFTHNNGTVKFTEDSSAASTVTTTSGGADSFYNLTIAIPDYDYIESLASDVEVVNDLTISYDSTAGVGGAPVFSLGGNTLTVGGDVSITYGTLDASNASANLLVTGNVSVTGGTLSAPAADDNDSFQVGGTWDVSGTGVFTHSSGRVNFNGAIQSITGTTTFNNINVNSGATVTNNGTVTAASLGAGTGAWTQGANSHLIYSGTAAITPTLTATASGNGVSYIANNAVTVSAATYYNLGIGYNLSTSSGATLTASRVYTLSNNATVSNVLTIGSASGSYTATLSGGASNYTTTLSGTGTPLVLNAQGLISNTQGGVSYTHATSANIAAATYYNLTLGSGTYAIGTNTVSVAGTLSNSGTVTVSTGTVTIPNAAAGNFSFTSTNTIPAATYSTLTVNASGGTLTAGGTLGATTLTITAGTLAMGSNALTVNTTLSNSGTVTVSTGTVTIPNAAAGNFTFTGANTIPAATYTTLTINASGAAVAAAGAINATNITVTAGTLQQAAAAITTTGDISFASGALFTKNAGGSITMNGTTPTLTDSNTTKQDLGAVTINSNASLGAGVQVTSLTINADKSFNLAGYNFAFTNAASTATNNGNFKLQGGETLTNVSGLGGGTVTYMGNGNGSTNTYTIKDFGASDYGTLVVNFTDSSDVLELGAALKVTAAMTVTAGTLDVNSYALDLTGATTTNNSTIRLQGTETFTNFTPSTSAGTIEYDGTSAYTGLILGDAYYNLIFSGAGGEWDLDAALTVNGALTLTNGTVDLNGNNLTVKGNVARTSGALSNTAGRTVTLSGTDAQNFNPGTITFADLTLSGGAGTVTLSSGFTVTGTLTVGTGKTLALADQAVTLSGDLSNSGTITHTSGYISKANSAFYIADSSFDIDPAISMPGDKVYISLADQTPNITSGSADTLTITVACPNDSESVTLTETGNGTGVFRNNGLTTAVYSGSATNNSGTLSCANSDTITASYADPWDAADTGSSTATATTDTIPTAPSALVGAAASSTSINWTWTDNSSNETGFKLYDQNGVLKATIATANSTSYTESSLTKGTTYQRKLVAYNAAGSSSYSSTVTVTTPAEPTAPSLMAGTATTSTSITWTWTDNSNDETGFKIYSSAGTLITTIATANTTTYTESSLTRDTAYSRYVAAYNADGTSSASNTATVSTRASVPDSFAIISPADGAVLSAANPSFSFYQTKDTDDGVARYVLYIDSDRSYTIPISANASNSSGKTHHDDKFGVVYHNEGDGNENNDSITVTLKVALASGSHSWYVTAYDNGGNTRSTSQRAFTIDDSVPSLSSAQIKADNISTSEVRPIIKLSFTDDRTLKEAVITLEKPGRVLGAYTAIQTSTYTFNEARGSVSFTPNQDLTPGTSYRLVISLTDMAGNTIKKTITLSILSVRQQAQEAVNELNPSTAPTAEIIEKLRATMPTNPINLPALQQAVLVRRQQQEAVLNDFLSQLQTRVGQPLLSLSGPFRSLIQQILAALNRGANAVLALIQSTNRYIASLTLPLRQISFDFKPPHFISQAQDTRVRAGLKNRQAINTQIDKIVRPAVSMSRNISMKMRATYEMWLDKEPTRIADVQISDITSSTAKVSWNTNHLTRNGKVNYGETTSYGQEVMLPDVLEAHHEATLINLKPNTTYYFEVMNQQGDYVFDAYYSLTTAKEGADAVPGALVPTDAVIRESRINIRAEASTESKIIGRAAKGDRFRILTQTEGWYSVLLPQGGQGWVLKEMVEVEPTAY